MRSDIISYINGKVSELGVFGSVNGFCEIRQKEKNSYPAVWVGGEFKSVNDFDFKKGIIYHRQVGNTTVADSVLPDSEIKNVTYPLRLVGAIRRKGYNDDMVVTGVVSKIQENTTSSLSANIKANGSSVNVTAWTTDKALVEASELLNTKKITDDYSYFYIDYSVTITVDIRCLDFCESDFAIYKDGSFVTYKDGGIVTYK